MSPLLVTKIYHSLEDVIHMNPTELYPPPDMGHEGGGGGPPDD